MNAWRRQLVDDDDGLRSVLRTIRTIAVLGAKRGAGEAAFYVPAYLQSHGYHVIPVNPTLEGGTLYGEAVIGTLRELPAPVDAIEVFRRPDVLPAHAEEILALPWRPAVVWFQLGIRNDAAAERLARAGIRVVQDRCMMPEHMRLMGERG